MGIAGNGPVPRFPWRAEGSPVDRVIDGLSQTHVREERPARVQGEVGEPEAWVYEIPLSAVPRRGARGAVATGELGLRCDVVGQEPVCEVVGPPRLDVCDVLRR